MANKLLFIAADSNPRTIQYAKEKNLPADYINYEDIFLTNSGFFNKDLERLDFSQYEKIIMFQGSNSFYKGTFVKALRNLFPKPRIYNVQNFPSYNWHWANKFETYLAITEMGLISAKAPKTLAIGHYTNPDQIIKTALLYFETFPLILKPTQGSRGDGVMKVDSEQELKDALNDVHYKTKNYFVIQEFVESETNFDVRVITLRGNIIGAMKRTSTDPQEFRNNLSLGGSAESYDYKDDHDLQHFIRDFHTRVSLFSTGFDFMYDHDGNLFMIELTTLPQSKGFNKINNINFAKLKLDAIIAD